MTATVDFSPDQLRQAVEKALKQWHDTDAAFALTPLALFQKLHRTGQGNVRHTANQLLLAGLTALEAEKPRLAHLLRLRYLNFMPVDQTANQLGLEEPTIYALQRDAFTHLTRLIHVQEVTLRTEQQQHFKQRLTAPTYTTLIGVDVYLAQLYTQLIQPGPPWLVAIEGIGGIGKTALADGVVRHLIAHTTIDAVVWVTARPPDFDLGGSLATWQQPALTSQELIHKLIEQMAPSDHLLTTLPSEKQLAWLHQQLKTRPHLIVIDNLETFVDVECLWPLLRELSNPTRFLLTSRERFDAPGFYHFTVPELTEEDAAHLVRQEAHVGNLLHVANAANDELRPIYETVGGNPLALRLVVGQTHADSLALILEDLVQARGAKAEELYTFIYRRAWEKLDETTRRTWLALPLLTAAQATAVALTELSGEPLLAVRQALAQLARLNLVYCHGGINERYYTLHNLTRTFLQQQVGEWQ